MSGVSDQQGDPRYLNSSTRQNGIPRCTETMATENTHSDTDALKTFLSYAWESEEHRRWVRSLAEHLVSNRVPTLLDHWDLRPGMDFVRYMETSVRESAFVLLVCTPTFAKKANERTGGVGYEGSIITAEIFRGAPETKFVPLLREGAPENALPSYLGSKIFIDFTDDRRFDSSLEELLRHIYDVPRFVRPQLGLPPRFVSTATNMLEAIHERSTTDVQGTSRTAAGRWRSGKSAPIPVRRSHNTARYNENVFINARLDEEFRPLLHAIIFTIVDCGFVPRSVLEFESAGETRLARIARMIGESRYGIHDISPHPGDSSPNLNASFELGMFIGAQQLGSGSHKQKSFLILAGDRYQYQNLLSDLAGLDIQAHGYDPARVIRTTRDWLASHTPSQLVPSGARIHQRFVQFQAELPRIFGTLKIDPNAATFIEILTIIQSWAETHPV